MISVLLRAEGNQSISKCFEVLNSLLIHKNVPMSIFFCFFVMPVLPSTAGELLAQSSKRSADVRCEVMVV